jgi:ParB-like chromosome segregation protein Spo0J
VEIEKIELSKIKPAKYNPRKDLKKGDAEYERIKKSIIEFGLVDPLIVNTDFTLIAGHQRLKILRELHFSEVDCVVLRLTKKKEKALNLALNKITGKWDNALLKDLLQDLDTGSFDMELTGFSTIELENLLTVIPDIEENDDKFDFDKKGKVNCPRCGHEFEL